MDSGQAYLAYPSGECCLKGTLHHGEPRGTWEDVTGVQTYISHPPEGKSNGNVVVYFPDVWGMFTNALLLMDAFADAGYLVLGLDYFQGDPVWKYRKDRHDKSNPTFDYEAWKKKHMAFAIEAVPRWMDAVKDRYSNGRAKFACVGYCFGAPFVCNELAKDTHCVGAFAHPAFLKEHHFANLQKPIFLSCAEIDHTFDSSSRRKALDIMKAAGKVYQHQLFSGVEHGFALRCNLDDPYQKWVKTQSFQAILAWFDYWTSV